MDNQLKQDFEGSHTVYDVASVYYNSSTCTYIQVDIKWTNTKQKLILQSKVFI